VLPRQSPTNDTRILNYNRSHHSNLRLPGYYPWTLCLLQDPHVQVVLVEDSWTHALHHFVLFPWCLGFSHFGCSVRDLAFDGVERIT
jgi:hypothetical protein